MVTAIIPAYNEEKNVVSVIKKTQKYADTIIFINDGSNDKTLELVKQNFKKIKIISFGENHGKGYALIKGFEEFLKTGDDIAVTLDSDGQHDPVHIPMLAFVIKNDIADVVIGSRFSKVRKAFPRARAFLNVFSSIALLFASGTFFTDVASGYRAFSRHSIETILPQLNARDYSIELEVLKIVSEKNLRTAAVPISVIYTETSKKANFDKLMKSYIQFCWKYKKDIINRIAGGKI